MVARLGLVFMWNQDDSLLVRPGAGTRGPGAGGQGLGTNLQPGSLPKEGRKCSGWRWVGRSEPTPHGQ